jgi:hypothetical protein
MESPNDPETHAGGLSAAGLERGKRLGRRYVTMVFSVFALAFVVWSTKDLILAVFGGGGRPLPLPVAASAHGGEPSCAEELSAMELAVDRAISAAAHAQQEKEASEAYEGALAPEWAHPAGVESRCAAESPHGKDAFATLVRLRVAGEQLARRHARELAPLRRDVASFLHP